MKQVQWAILRIGEAGTREKVEELLNQRYPWELDSWKIVERGVDANNQPTVVIAVCMTREVVETAKAKEEVAEATAPKRGRPKKNA